MAEKFHDRQFDDGTQVKLAIFRGYVRSWIPVFLTARRAGRNQHVVRQVGRRQRGALPGEIAGRGAQPRDGQFADTHTDVDAFLQQVHHPGSSELGL